MTSAAWRCRLCHQWGRGGPDGWNKHYAALHGPFPSSIGSSFSFGFVPPRPSQWRFSVNPAPVVWAKEGQQ